MSRFFSSFLGMSLIFMVLVGISVTAISPVTARQKADIVLTKDNTISLSGSFTFSSVAEVAQDALTKALAQNKGPIYLVLDSGGGIIDAGAELIENLTALNLDVHTINLFSASMSFHTAQNLGERYITSTGTMMTHKASGGFRGEFPGQLDSRYNFWLRKVKLFDERVVSRTKGVHTLDSYHALRENEFWCTGQDCVKEGFADKVVSVTCAKNLSGLTSLEETMTFLGRTIIFRAEHSECPVITGFLSVEVLMDGKTILKRGGDISNNEALQLSDVSDLTASEIILLNQELNKILEKYTSRRTVVKGY